MSKLWGLGTAAVDFRIFTADYGENYRDKLLARQTMCFGGGAAANCLVQAARLGADTGWLGKLGRDIIAEKITELLKDEKIDCSQILYSDSESSPFNVAVYAGENKRRVGGFLIPNSLSSLTDVELEAFADAMKAGDWLMVEVGEIPLDCCIKLSTLAKKRGVSVALDVDLDPILQCGASREQAEMLFACADLLIPNINSLASLYSESEPQALCKLLFRQYAVPVVITVGARGAYYIECDGTLCHENALSVCAKDTVGAGDAFHGGLMFALTKGEALSQAVRMGTACAAVNCTAFGAREGMPDIKRALKEMEKFEQ